MITQMMKVPNNIVGRFFIWYLKKVLNTDTYRLQLRGRHPNRKKLFESGKCRCNHTRDVPVKYSKVIGVYIHQDKLCKKCSYRTGYEATVNRLQETINVQQLQIRRYQEQVASLQEAQPYRYNQ